MPKRTKIVCTIGPSSSALNTIKKMTEAGMNVARLNFSHGTYADHKKLLTNIRAVEKSSGAAIAVLQDLQGPKIRLGDLPRLGCPVKDGETVVFDTSKKKKEGKVFPLPFLGLFDFVKKGERMLFNDGKIEAIISEVSGKKIIAKIQNGGKFFSRNGINFPDSKLAVSALTKKDREDMAWGVKNEVDMIALSFVSSTKDILDLRYAIKEEEKKSGKKGHEPIRIIAKIERAGAVKNIAEILSAADGIMVARGDLGMEIPAAEVPLTQKRLIDLCLAAGKPVIVATQMLDSMRDNPRPTRAEVSDVANAVIDHSDALMLSNETATGKYPVETVATMSRIIEVTEKSAYDDLPARNFSGANGKGKSETDEIISEVSRLIAEKVGAKLILAASLSGDTGRLISRYRPELPIFVATSSNRVRRQLNLSWGVEPFILETCKTIEELVERSLVFLKKEKIVKHKDKLIVVAGEPVGQAGHVNLLEVREA